MMSETTNSTADGSMGNWSMVIAFTLPTQWRSKGGRASGGTYFWAQAFGAAHKYTLFSHWKTRF